MPTIAELIKEYLHVETAVAISESERTQQLLELLEQIRERRPLQDPMLVIERYRG